MLKIFGKSLFINVRKVLWLCAEMGAMSKSNGVQVSGRLKHRNSWR